MPARRRGHGPVARLGAAAVLCLAAGVANTQALPVTSDPTAKEPPVVILVGDSTLASQTGYGDALCQRLEPALACLNLARGGRSTKSYRSEGLWDRVIARLKASAPGVQQHVLIQFGHNDQPGKPGRSTDLATEFPANLARYVAEVRDAGGVPVLLTPLTRRSFKGDELQQDLAAWAAAVRDLARSHHVAWVDLNASSTAAVMAMGAEEAKLLARGPVGSPAFDRTHLGPRGACVFAEQVFSALLPIIPGLRPQQAAPDCSNAPPHAPGE
jgi:lysophospholipase L1-like esterase